VYGERVLVEKALVAKEYGVGVIGNGTLIQSAIVEFGGGSTFLDYESKYGADAYIDLIPAPLPLHLASAMREMANRVYRLLELRGMARLDFFVVGENIYFNEANTVPGFGRTSVFSRMWTVAGMDLQELITTLANLALEGNHSATGPETRMGDGYGK
jgi:D-alanine-D-alanine ligase